jgi:hypothetical protein
LADLKRKVGIVNGGRTGIGRAIALALAKASASLVIGNRNAKVGKRYQLMSIAASPKGSKPRGALPSFGSPTHPAGIMGMGRSPSIDWPGPLITPWLMLGRCAAIAVPNSVC